MNNDSQVDCRKLVSFCIPVLNEEQNLQQLYERIAAVAKDLEDRYRFEFFFTDNCSEDGTWDALAELSRQDPRVKGLRFARNFGFQASILTNYIRCAGDAIIQLDADLQDPPELARTFLDQWEKGNSVVYGVRRKRKENPLLNLTRSLGYYVISTLSDFKIPRHVGDFRLIDRKVVAVLQSYGDYSPYLRGAIAAIGLKQVGVPYDRESREFGESKFNLKSLIELGLDGLFNYSKVPLRLATLVGALAILFSVLWTVILIVSSLLQPDLPAGFTSTQILILFSLGLNSMFLGIIGEYVLRIYMNVRRGPFVVIQDSLALGEDPGIGVIAPGQS